MRFANNFKASEMDGAKSGDQGHVDRKKCMKEFFLES